MKQTDADLIARAAAGDDTALETLVGVHLPPLVRFCMKLVGQPADAEDCAQEALIKAVANLHRFQGRSEFYTWLCRIAINSCHDFQRRQARQAQRSLDANQEAFGAVAEPVDPQPLATETLERAEQIRQIREAIRKLPEPFRETLILFDLEGISYAEIAQIQGVPAGTVKSRLARARQRLRTLLESLQSDRAEHEAAGTFPAEPASNEIRREVP